MKLGNLFYVFAFILIESAASSVSSKQSLQSVPSIEFLKINKSGAIHIEGELSSAVALGNEISASFSFFETHKSSLFLTNPVQELAVDKVIHDRLGKTHIKFNQFYNDVRVITGQLFTHFDNENKIKTINGTLVRDIQINQIPTISSSEAVNNSISDLQSFFGTGTTNEAELVVFPWEGKTYLSWRMFLLSDFPMGRWEYFVDAHTGEIIYKANRIMSSDEIGTGFGVMGNAYAHIDTDFDGSTYRLIDNTRQISNNIHGHNGQFPLGNSIRTSISSSSLPGTIAADADNIWSSPLQAAAVDGHVYTGLFYDWLLSSMGRNSFDNNGAAMSVTVEYTAEGTNNAYWNGSRIVIWGASSGLNSLAGSPDVVAHEWGHAVTQFTSNLAYQLESGALNESFSDMMGAAFEFAHPQYDTPDWTMGENISFSSSGFRSLSNPHNNSDPDTYGTSDPYWFDVVNCTPQWNNDWCGVHTNSGVGNKWFYLLSDGGVHNGITVGGIGVQNAMKVVHQANAFYWTENSTYEEAAFGTISAASDLDTTFAWTIQVSKAWEAVGIYAPNPEINFTVDTSWGWVPLSVNLTGSSVLNVQTWDWDFGDGTTSTLQSPSHIFDSSGMFDVTLQINADGDIITLAQPNYIIALADTISTDSIETEAGMQVEVTIRIRNNTPLGRIYIPLEYQGLFALSFDSVSTLGCRTDYFDIQEFIHYDAFNKRFTYRLETNPINNTPELPAGEGDILKIYFTVSSSANPGDSVILSLDGYSTSTQYSAEFSGSALTYDAAFKSGKIMISSCLMRGDVNNDSTIDISDLVQLVGYFFNGGPAPSPIDLADIDCSSGVDISDIVLLVAFMFNSGAPPCGC